MPELIADGTTGFLVEEIEGAVAAVGRSQDLDRAVIRAEAVARFGIGRMVEAYIAVYEEVARGGV
jgi:glycosyltransferase involved in cell wall biosynthesis